MENFFVGCYRRFAPYRMRLLFVCGVFTALSAFGSSRFMVSEDVRALIPDSPPALARDLDYLSAAPFAHYAVLSIGGEQTNPLALVKKIREQLQTQGLHPLALPDPQHMSLKKALHALDYLPSLLDAGQYEKALSERIVTRGEEQLRDKLRVLHSLQGLAQREYIAKDPFSLHLLALNRFAGLSFLRGTQIKEGNILSADGKYALLMIAAPTTLTDSAGAERFMAALHRAVQDMPPQAELLIVGGHRHSAENAVVVKDDLKRVLPPTLILLILICLAFIRSRWGIVLFVLPLASLCAASGITGLVFGGLSGIVLGFGGVLLGITTDYAVHMYYALRDVPSPERGLRAVVRPLFSAALTSVGAFSVLFFSRIPVLSQLAVFAVSGLSFAFLCALCVLPQFIAPGGTRCNDAPAGETRPASVRPKTGALIAVWLCIAVCLAALLMQTRVDGDIRRLGYVSPQLRYDEERTRQLWGNTREGGMVVVSGNTLEETLQKNEDATAVLRRLPEAGHVTSLDILLPSERTQNERHALWKMYWERHASDALRLLAAFSEREGLSSTAFAPFEKLIREKPPLITPDVLADAGLGFLPDMLLLRDEATQRFFAYILHAENAVFSSEAVAALEKVGAHPLSAARFRQEMSEAAGRDIVLFGVLSFCILALLLVSVLRSPARAASALTAPGCGLAAVFGWFYLTGAEVNIYHIVALPLVMGLGVDYGIFMLHRRGQSRATQRAVLVSALTTLAAFACLVPARHPALFSLGSAVCCGVSGAVLCALFLVPLLEGRISEEEEKA